MNDASTPDTGTQVRLRLQGAVYNAIQDWRRQQAQIPSLTEAVRRLIAQGLDASNRYPRPRHAKN